METFDYVVVGAGSAGCVVAARLSEDPKVSVLLLEAGGDDSHYSLRMPVAFLKAVLNPAFNWGYRQRAGAASQWTPVWLPRGEVLGGSCSINGMFYMRGHPLDYREWEELGASGWGYEDVLPYFRRHGEQLARRREVSRYRRPGEPCAPSTRRICCTSR